MAYCGKFWGLDDRLLAGIHIWDVAPVRHEAERWAPSSGRHGVEQRGPLLSPARGGAPGAVGPFRC